MHAHIFTVIANPMETHPLRGEMESNNAERKGKEAKENRRRPKEGWNLEGGASFRAIA